MRIYQGAFLAASILSTVAATAEGVAVKTYKLSSVAFVKSGISCDVEQIQDGKTIYHINKNQYDNSDNLIDAVNDGLDEDLKKIEPSFPLHGSIAVAAHAWQYQPEMKDDPFSKYCAEAFFTITRLSQSRRAEALQKTEAFDSVSVRTKISKYEAADYYIHVNRDMNIWQINLGDGPSLDVSVDNPFSLSEWAASVVKAVRKAKAN